jgi:hypothetical protein
VSAMPGRNADSRTRPDRPLRRKLKLGQPVSIDYLSCELPEACELPGLVDTDAVVGVDHDDDGATPEVEGIEKFADSSKLLSGLETRQPTPKSAAVAR